MPFLLILSLALRYTTRRLVNYVAILAIAVALMVQIVAGGILDGMIEGFKRRVRGVGEQVGVTFGGSPLPRAAFETVAEELLAAHPGDLEGVTPFLSRYALIQRRGGTRAAHGFGEVWCVDLAREVAFSSLRRQILGHVLDPDDPSWFPPGFDPKGRAPLFMGETLASKLDVVPGDDIEIVFAQAKEGEDGGYEPVTARFVLTALYRSGSWQRDGYGVYIPLSSGVPFFLGGQRAERSVPVAVPEMVCWLRDPERAKDLEPAIGQTVAASLESHRWNWSAPDAAGLRHRRTVRTSNWIDQWSSVFAAMKNENNLVELVLALYMFSGGFCVFAILATLASRRVRDVGLLRCIGAGRGTVAAVFLLVGLWLGLAGTALGTGGGLWLLGPNGKDDRRPRVDVYYTGIMGRSMYPPEMYGAQEDGAMPVVVSAPKIALYASGALLVTILAALYPALWAATREPMAALRDEG